MFEILINGIYGGALLGFIFSLFIGISKKT